MRPQEIETLITDAKRNYSLQHEFLESWPTSFLVLTLAFGTAQVVEIIIWAIDDDRVSPVTMEERGYRLAHQSTLRVAQAVWDSSRSVDLMRGLVERLILIDAIKGELSRRAPGAVSREMLNPSRREDFLEDLPLRSVDSESEEGKELHQNTWQTLLEGAKNMRRSAGPRLRDVHIPPVTIFGMPVRLSGPRWRDWPVRQEGIVKEVLRSVLPALTGQVEELVQQVEDYIKHYTTTRPETERRGARRRRAILRKRTNDIANAREESDTGDVLKLTPVEKQVNNRKAKEDLVTMARSIRGEKMAKAVSFVVIDGMKQVDAARLADVPYQSLRRCMSKLRKIRSQPA